MDMDTHFGATISVLLTISLITETRKLRMEGNEIFAKQESSLLVCW